MYQQKENIEQNEDDFNGLYGIFNNQVFNMEKEPEDNFEYDMNATYSINHICIWNKRNSLNLTCSIVQKNNKIALVRFNKEDKDKLKNISLLNCIFRLEDLSKI